MIISDKYRFVFIHIPKCAGSSMRSKIQKLDDTNGYFTGRIEKHPVLGRLNFVHIPLFTLKKYFPVYFNKILDYETFCIVRDPYSRFLSSLFQNINRYNNKTHNHLKKRQLIDNALRCIDHLNTEDKDPPTLLKPEFIHFQRQKDYIFIDSQKMIDRIFIIDNFDDAIEYVQSKTAFQIDEFELRKNKSVVYKNDFLRKMVLAGKKVFSNNKIALMAYKKIFSLITKPRDNRFYRDLFSDDNIKNFVTSYYREDLKLYRHLKRNDSFI